MTGLAITLAIAIAGMLPVIAWLVYGRISDGRALLVMDDERDKAVQRAERLSWESEQKDKALDAAAKTIDALLKEKRHAKPNADLADDDVLSRGVRAAEEARAGGGDPISTSTVDPVPSREAAGAAKASEVLPSGLLDPNESLL